MKAVENKIQTLLEEGLKDLTLEQKQKIMAGIGGAGSGAVMGNIASNMQHANDTEVLLATLLGGAGMGTLSALGAGNKKG
jgi:signal recognition particle GTPase